ncbi:hypothetical protein Tco_1137525, partial [Tanacetum coccineum]
LMLILFVDNHPELVDLLGDVFDAPSCSDMLAAVNTKLTHRMPLKLRAHS